MRKLATLFLLFAMLWAPAMASAQALPDSVRAAGVTEAEWRQVQDEVRRAAAARGASERALAALAARVGANLVVNGRVDIDQVVATIDDRAQQLVELRAQLTAMQSADDPAIAAILEQAAEAYEAGDLARFDTLLGQAAESDLAGIERDRARLVARQTRAANTIAQRALLASFGNDYLATAALYRQAASAAPASDPRRVAYSIGAAEALLNRANRFGEAEHLRNAVQAFREALANSPRATDESQWAYVQKGLGDALMILGDRGDTHALREAATAYRAALEYYTPEDHTIRRGWALKNLGGVLQLLGERTGDLDALREAATVYREALGLLRQSLRNANLIIERASLETKLGGTLYVLARRTNDEATREEATQVLRRALNRLNSVQRMRNWAIAEHNLGAAFLRVGEDGDQQALHDAVTAFRAALTYHTRENAPAFWSGGQNNLGRALFLLGAQGDQQALSESVVALRAALELSTRANDPRGWASAQYNLASALKLQAQGQRNNRALLEQARAAARAAVEGYEDVRDARWIAQARRLVSELEALP